VDGRLVVLSEACIPVTDEGLLRGDGVFEVVRVYPAGVLDLDAHLARMEASAANLRLALDAAAARADAHTLLEATGPTDAILRLLVTRGGRRIALLEPLPTLPASLSLGLVTYAPTRVLDGIKSLSYAANMLATRLARERGFDEALLHTPHGRVLEAPTASFCWVRDGRVVTPPLSEHLLDSITRRRLMAVADVEEAPLTVTELAEIDEAFLASTVREVLPVGRIEDRALPADGPVTIRAQALLKKSIEAALASA
jgi:branched-chain amino acid aminotransferase